MLSLSPFFALPLLFNWFRALFFLSSNSWEFHPKLYRSPIGHVCWYFDIITMAYDRCCSIVIKSHDRLFVVSFQFKSSSNILFNIWNAITESVGRSVLSTVWYVWFENFECQVQAIEKQSHTHTHTINMKWMCIDFVFFSFNCMLFIIMVIVTFIAVSLSVCTQQ